MKATIVFEKIWDAIHAKNEDGSRKYKYIINTGSSRSSKTHSILQSHWLKSLSKENTRVSIWRETKADCKMTILADLKKAIPSLPKNENVIFNKTESMYTFQNGSTIEFMGGDEENRVHGFQGNIAHLNEPYKFGLDAFNQIDMRTSDYIIIDWNPKNNHWIEDLSKRHNAIVIHSTYKDNPFIPDEQRKKIESYDPSNPFNIEQGTASQYLHDVYALGKKSEKPNKVYKNWKIITDKEFEILPYSKYYGLDFGSTNPTALVEVKFDGEKTFFAKEKLYLPISKMSSTLSEVLQGLGIDKKIPLICDSADPIKISELIQNGFNAIPAVKGGGSVKAGIDFISAKNIYVTSGSENLIREEENYEWEIINNVNLDRPIKKDDHILDAFRYIVTYLQFYLSIK